MRTREVTVPWNEMREGDTFVRFEERDPSDKVVVTRSEPDLPDSLGSMGYATIKIGNDFRPGMLVIKARDRHAHLTWMAPFVEDMPGRWLHENQISDFDQVRTASIVTADQVREALLSGSGKSQRDLDFMGVNLDDMTYAVLDLFYQGD